MTGKVFLVGAGPGDPDLLTLKGKKLLQKADVVVYDRLVSRAILACSKKKALMIDVGKEAGNHKVAQDEIATILVHHALEGKMVVRLKGGDPFVFGRGAEEIDVLQAHGISFEVVPGISSAIAVPAYAGIPVTCRNIASAFTVMTGHAALATEQLAIIGSDYRKSGTLVILMGMERLTSIMEQLLLQAWPETMPVAVIRAGTTLDQEVVVGTIATIAQLVKASALKPPGLIVVGDVVRLRETHAWFEEKSVRELYALAGEERVFPDGPLR